MLEENQDKDFGLGYQVWTKGQAIEWIKKRMWLDLKEAIEWIEKHSEDIHRKALESCVDYPYEEELTIFDLSYQSFIDSMED